MTRSRLSSDSSLTSNYYTGREESEESKWSTAVSTPAYKQTCPYRRAGELSRDLKAHCQIFLEEQLYLGAINLLNSMLGAGASKKRPNDKPVPIPPATHLALLNTITIHPSHTTRAEKAEHLDVSSLALAYLRNVLEIVGPLNADFRTAFRFHDLPRWGRRVRSNGHESDSDLMDGDSDAESNPLQGRMANESSLWSKGQDFWRTVGWAFNCCTSMPHRWRYWKAWLEFMLDVLEADWNERERLDEEAHAARGGEGDVPITSRSQAMMVMYMDQSGGRQGGGFKGIMKALFVYGGSASSAAFQEIFEKEHKGPRNPSNNKRKRDEVLDLANDRFGDYFDDDCFSSGVSEPPTPQKTKAKRNSELQSQGMVESVDLRLRLFKLLSAVIHWLRRPRAELNRLYEEFAAGIKVLPLEVYSLFVTQRPNPLLMESHISLTKDLFRLLLPSSYKDPAKVDSAGCSIGGLTMPMLEQCYACHPANTVSPEDNAKLSLLVENAIQLLWFCDVMEYTDKLADAVERGIIAREAKIQKRRTAKARVDQADAHAWAVLRASHERIRLLLEVLKGVEVGD